MALDETTISEAIIEHYVKKLKDHLRLDVAIVGGGPSGLVAAYYLAKSGRKVALFEKEPNIGGGMWGGGMMFNEIVVQQEGKRILDIFNVPIQAYGENYYTADSVETISTICSKVCNVGAKIFNLINVEDVMVHERRVVGLVINWTAIELAGFHIDPLCIRSRFVVDATGHQAVVANIIQRKMGPVLMTETGQVMGEKSMWAEVAENSTLENTREVFPGVYVAGMAANATFGSYRMGPIFGGMLLSGEKVAQTINAQF